MEMIYFLLFIFELLILFLFSRFITSSFATIFMRVTKSQKVTIHLLSFLFLPGVIIHELAHMFVASILFVRVGEIEFWPQIKEDGVKLGSVAVGQADPFRRTLIGIAPVLVGLAVIISSLWFFTSDVLVISPIIKYILLVYILFEVGNTMFSSKKDMEGTLVFASAIVVILLAVFLAGFRLPFIWVWDFFSQESTVAVVRQAVLFLLAPIGVDAVVLGITRLFGRR